MSARASDGRTSFSPENDGLPFSSIIFFASAVSASSTRTCPASGDGRSARASSLAPSDTHLAASLSRTAGSSIVCSDFS